MKKFFLSLLILLAIFIALDRVWGFLIAQNRNIKLSYVRNTPLDPDVLIHGPCEPLFTLDPTFLSQQGDLSYYNYALRHTDFADNYLHLYLYLKRNPAPKYLLLYATPESFDLRFNSFHTFRFAPFLEDSVVAGVVAERDPDYYRYTLIPFARYAYFNSYKTWDAIQGLKHWMQGEASPYFEDGFVPHPNTEYTESLNGFIPPQKLTYAAGNQVEYDDSGGFYYEIYDSAEVFVWDASRENYFRKILDLARDSGIQTIVYESTPFWGSVAYQPNRRIFLNRIQSITREYDVPFWIFDTLEIGANRKNFVCPLILGQEGGKAFMKELVKKMKAIHEPQQKP